MRDQRRAGEDGRHLARVDRREDRHPDATVLGARRGPQRHGPSGRPALPEPRGGGRVVRRPDRGRVRHAGSIAAGRRLPDPGEARHRRASSAGVRRQLGVRGLRLRPERRAEHDAVGSRHLPPRSGDRYGRLLQDHELERSADVHLLRRRRGGRPAVPRGRRRAAHSFPPRQRRTGKSRHPGAGGRDPRARHRRGAREAFEQVRDGRSQGVGVRRRPPFPESSRRCSPSTISGLRISTW